MAWNERHRGEAERAQREVMEVSGWVGQWMGGRRVNVLWCDRTGLRESPAIHSFIHGPAAALCVCADRPPTVYTHIHTHPQLKEREAGLRAQLAKLEARGVEQRADLDRVLTEQAEVLIQVRRGSGWGEDWFRS